MPYSHYGQSMFSWQHEESLLTGDVRLFPKFTTTSKFFFVLLIVTSLDVMYYNFACSLHCLQDIDAYQDGNSPIVVDQSLFLMWA